MSQDTASGDLQLACHGIIWDEKTLATLLAMQAGACIIFDLDDDNIPLNDLRASLAQSLKPAWNMQVFGMRPPRRPTQL